MQGSTQTGYGHTGECGFRPQNAYDDTSRRAEDGR